MGGDYLRASLNAIQVLDKIFGSMFFACIGMIISTKFITFECYKYMCIVLKTLIYQLQLGVYAAACVRYFYLLHF